MGAEQPDPLSPKLSERGQVTQRHQKENQPANPKVLADTVPAIAHRSFGANPANRGLRACAIPRGRDLLMRFNDFEKLTT